MRTQRVLGRDSDTGTILGRHIAMFAPPSGELSPDKDARVEKPPGKEVRAGK